MTDSEGNQIEYKYDNEGNLHKLEFDILGKTQAVNYDHNEEFYIALVNIKPPNKAIIQG